MKKHKFWAWAMIVCLAMTVYTGHKHKETGGMNNVGLL